MKKLLAIITVLVVPSSCQGMNEMSSSGAAGATIIYVQFDAETFKPVSKENIIDVYNCSFFVPFSSKIFNALSTSFDDHVSGGAFNNKIVRAKFINLFAEEAFVDREGVVLFESSKKTFRLSTSAFSNIKGMLADLEILQSKNCRPSELLRTIPKP